MNKEFFDWLNECPVAWFRQSEDTEGVVYRFHNWEPDWNELTEKEND